MSKQSLGILAEVLTEFGDTREGIPEELKRQVKLEAAWALAAKLTTPIPAEPEPVAELIEAWLIILPHVAKKHGLRVQLSFSRLREKPKPAESAEAEPAEAEPAEAEPAEAEEPAEEPAEAEPAEAEEPAE